MQLTYQRGTPLFISQFIKTRVLELLALVNHEPPHSRMPKRPPSSTYNAGEGAAQRADSEEFRFVCGWGGGAILDNPRFEMPVFCEYLLSGLLADQFLDVPFLLVLALKCQSLVSTYCQAY